MTVQFIVSPLLIPASHKKMD